MCFIIESRGKLKNYVLQESARSKHSTAARFLAIQV